MTDPLTDQQLAHYTELEAAATPGPWHLTDAGAIVAPLSSDEIADVWEPTQASRNGEFIEGARKAMPVLLAEIRRLRAELATALRPHTPRLCACGHSNLAHTVPAPHSCFAYGQTCPCEAFRQLPHDEAVEQLKRNQAAAVPAAESGV